MPFTVTPDQDGILTALRSFLLLLVTVDVIDAQDNRVPEPAASDFIEMTPVHQSRLSFNVDGAADVAYTGSVAGTTLTISAMLLGTVVLGATLFGQGVSTNTVIQVQLTGTPGGVGTYQVSISQTVSSTKMASGAKVLTQAVAITVQLDIHGPNAFNTAQIITTTFFDDYAVEQFATLNTMVAPLYCSEPRQMAFNNAERQYENRWVVEVTLQVNTVVTAAQQYADTVTVDLVSVEATFPA